MIAGLESAGVDRRKSRKQKAESKEQKAKSREQRAETT
jgi:Spy/CpxP family protein refolding chaperone